MFALRRDAKVTIAEKTGAVADQDDREQPERAIVCATCAASVTSPEHRIAVQGAQEHRFMNPTGVLFHIGCFACAIGCTIVGPDSLEYPWFPGFAWRYAMCGSCGQHLGWHFHKDSDSSFFGLILDRLRQPAQDG
jgi:hypothetical protein